MTTTLIVPGLNSSGPSHWQTWLEERIPRTARVTQGNWQDADLPAWASRVRQEISRASGPVFIVAHSFGAIAAVQAAHDHAHRVSGALLVAPADPEKFGVTEYLPSEPLAFPATVVASTNDPWMAVERAAQWAGLWGAEFVNLGAAGHINADSGFGPWPEALALIARLQQKGDTHETQPARGEPRVFKRARGLRSHVSASARTRAIPAYNGDLMHAAVLLQDAGWRVTPPRLWAHVASA